MPLFGYADSKKDTSTLYGDVELAKGAVYNPYKEDGDDTIGEAFDLSWAVDEDGKPVNLESISYIKVQTATDIF